MAGLRKDDPGRAIFDDVSGLDVSGWRVAVALRILAIVTHETGLHRLS